MQHEFVKISVCGSNPVLVPSPQRSAPRVDQAFQLDLRSCLHFRNTTPTTTMSKCCSLLLLGTLSLCRAVAQDVLGEQQQQITTVEAFAERTYFYIGGKYVNETIVCS
jgi:hypothetical protein